MEVIPHLAMSSNPTSVKECRASPWRGVPMIKIPVSPNGAMHHHAMPILYTLFETHLQQLEELIIPNPHYRLQYRQHRTTLSCISVIIPRRHRLLSSRHGTNTQLIISQRPIRYISNRQETNPINTRRLNMQVHSLGQCHSLHKLCLRTVHTHRRYHRKWSPLGIIHGRSSLRIKVLQTEITPYQGDRIIITHSL